MRVTAMFEVTPLTYGMIGLFQVSQGWISLDLFHQICTVSFIYNASDARIIIGPRKVRRERTYVAARLSLRHVLSPTR